MTALCAAALAHAADLSMLQFGLEWFPDGIGGGSSRYFSSLAEHLQSQNVRFNGIAAGRDCASGTREPNIRIVGAFDAPLMRRLRAARAAVRDVLAHERIEIVASHFALFTFACLDLVKELPMVVHFHGPWALESRVEGASRLAVRGRFFVERRVYSRAQKAIVLTHAFKEVLHREYRVAPEKIAVIPGGVDVERFNCAQSRSAARTRLRLPQNRPIILTVRRLAKRMGLENLLASFADLGKKHADALLVIVGGGRLSSDLEARAKAYGLEQRVVFAGRVPDEQLPLYYRAANVSIVPSVSLEGFGLVVAESLACGTPAIVTPVGGLPEVVGALSEQLILENSTSGAITQGLSAVLDGRLHLPSADACEAYARSHFSWPIVAKRVKSVYEELL